MPHGRVLFFKALLINTDPFPDRMPQIIPSRAPARDRSPRVSAQTDAGENIKLGQSRDCVHHFLLIRSSDAAWIHRINLIETAGIEGGISS